MRPSIEMDYDTLTGKTPAAPLPSRLEMATQAARTFRERRSSTDDWYKPGLKIKEFHASRAKTRVLVGARGSGKTSGCAMEAIRHCTHYAGARVLCVRVTQISNEDTTVKTFNETYDKIGYKMGEDEEISLFRKWDGGLRVRIPSRDAITAYNEFVQGGEMGHRTKAQIKTWLANEGDRLCGIIEFRGLKDENKAQGQLRGFECSMMIFVEADLLTESDLELGRGCLRWKDAYGEHIPDCCAILDTNPPDLQHWIAKMEDKQKNNANYAFWHIPTYENRHNLPPDYIEMLEDQYRHKPAHWNRYLLGLYADLFEGSPVLWAYHGERHAYRDLPWPKGAYLIRGWDFGSTHANIWSAYFKIDYNLNGNIVPFEYWWDLFEYYQEQSDTDRQCDAVMEITDREFPFWNDRSICSGVFDYCDPAGAAKTDKGSSVEVLNKNGIYPAWQTRVRSLDTTIAIYNRLLESKDPNRRYIYRLDKVGCPRLHRASLGEYRYPNVGEAGYASGDPIKGPKANGADHVVDSSRYPKLNALRLAQKMIDQQAKKPAIGQLANLAKKLNRLKSY